MTHVKIAEPSAGVVAKSGDLVLIKGVKGTCHGSSTRGALEHELWAGHEKVRAISQQFGSVQVVIELRKTVVRRIATIAVTSLHLRSSDPRPTLG